MGEDAQDPFLQVMTAVIVKAVHAGEWDGLATWIEEGYPITDDMRTALVAILRGQVSRRKGRQRSIATIDAGMQQATFFVEEQDRGTNRDRAYEATASKFGTDRRTIERNVKTYEPIIRHGLAWLEKERKLGRIP
jgi:hypothetical protein